MVGHIKVDAKFKNRRKNKIEEFSGILVKVSINYLLYKHPTKRFYPRTLIYELRVHSSGTILRSPYYLDQSQQPEVSYAVTRLRISINLKPLHSGKCGFGGKIWMEIDFLKLLSLKFLFLGKSIRPTIKI